MKQKPASSQCKGIRRLDKLYFKNMGIISNKGQKLYDLYSEELNNAQQEYILALEKQATLDNSIIEF